jgi:hypothetical protein
MRASFLMLTLALSVAAGCNVRGVPVEQAAGDLACDAANVHVSIGWRAQIAEGCGRKLVYVERCAEGGKVCRFEVVRSWSER